MKTERLDDSTLVLSHRGTWLRVDYDPGHGVIWVDSCNCDGAPRLTEEDCETLVDFIQRCMG